MIVLVANVISVRSKIFLVFVLSTLSVLLYSQENDASIVVGLETNFLIYPNVSNERPRVSSVKGVTIQKPIGQFSVGIGFLTKDFNAQYKYAEATGNTMIRQEEVTYEYDFIVVDPAYNSFATRVYYRLNCNCFYFFGGMEVDFLKSDLISIYENHGYSILEFLDDDFEIVSVKEKVYNFNFGVGVNLPFSKRLRFFARPSVILSQNIYSSKQPQKYTPDFSPSFFQLSVGAEYGFGAIK